VLVLAGSSDTQKMSGYMRQLTSECGGLWQLCLLNPCPRQKSDHGCCAVQFLRRHVRMKDVREYIRDALIMYSSLQSFQPKPNAGARASTHPGRMQH